MQQTVFFHSTPSLTQAHSFQTPNLQFVTQSLLCIHCHQAQAEITLMKAIRHLRGIYPKHLMISWLPLANQLMGQ